MKRFAVVLLCIMMSVQAFAGLDEGQAAFDRKDYKTALKEWQPLAEGGNAYAQKMLGMIYDLGLGGIRSDDKQAFGWYYKAAQQGDSMAQAKVGHAYQYGDGVAKDDKQAMLWYRKSAAQGNNLAQDNLRLMQAEADAAQCDKAATTLLFNTKIRCTNRDEFRQAVKSAGNVVKREDRDFWVDQYKSETVLDGSDEFSVGYTSAGAFAYAEYTIPSGMDTGKVVAVKEMVARKYGQPQKAHGNPDLGEVQYSWKVKDGIEIFVSRGWPDTTVFLTYREPKNNAVMQDEIKSAQAVSQQEKQNQQTQAF